MFLQSLSIAQFKNYQDTVDLHFNSDIVCFTGLNGAGKTNLLDAIHYLCCGKSYFNFADSQNINDSGNYFTIEGRIATESQETVFCGYTRGQKKRLRIGETEIPRLSEFYGKYPVTMISPSDLMLITEGSESRRRFIDSTLSVFNTAYLAHLIEYNKVLAQRNALLKKLSERKSNSLDLLDVYDQQLVMHSEPIYIERQSFIEEFKPVFSAIITSINHHYEEVSIEYESQHSTGPLLNQLIAGRTREIALGRCEFGIHKDKLHFMMGDKLLKKFASQGQQKSYLIALKLAQSTFFHSKTGKKTILLLDDIFDRLDQQRAARLLAFIADCGSQVFITDTSEKRMKETLGKLVARTAFHTIEKGNVSSTHRES